jgi:hypothetical protein
VVITCVCMRIYLFLCVCVLVMGDRRRSGCCAVRSMLVVLCGVLGGDAKCSSFFFIETGRKKCNCHDVGRGKNNDTFFFPSINIKVEVVVPYHKMHRVEHIQLHLQCFHHRYLIHILRRI